MSATYGLTSSTPFAFYDPDGSCWRTSQGTFPWDSTSCSVTWPRRGSMRSGACYGHLTWEPPTVDSACSSLLPTPVVNDMGAGKTVERWDEWTAEMQERHGNGNGHGRSLSIEVLRLLPTPRASDGADASSHGRTWSATDFNLHSWVREQVQGIPTRRSASTRPPSVAGSE